MLKQLVLNQYCKVLPLYSLSILQGTPEPLREGSKLTNDLRYKIFINQTYAHVYISVYNVDHQLSIFFRHGMRKYQAAFQGYLHKANS